jgi:glycosyltransferase involved in cell wall biosynthesis
MKIGIVTLIRPHPQRSGTRIRLFHICRRLAKDHQVFLADMEQDPSICIDSGVEYLCHDICRIPVSPVPALIRWTDRLRMRPFSADPIALRHLQDWYTRYDFDVVIAAKSLGFYYALNAGIPRRALRIVDDGMTSHLHYRTAAACSASPLQKLRLNLRSLKLDRAERAMARECDLVVTPSPEEAASLGSKYGQEKTVVVPNGVDTGYFSVRPWKGKGNGELLFFGTFRFEANVDAARYLIDEILPLLPQDRRVCLVGEDPPKELRDRASRDPRVRVIGYVEDLRPYLEWCGAVVIPVRIGTGTRLKILHAMAAGCPVVSTPIGAMGIGAVDGEEIVIANTVKAFATAVTKIKEDRAFARVIGDAGRALVQRSFDWDIIVGAFEQILGERLAAKREDG